MTASREDKSKQVEEKSPAPDEGRSGLSALTASGAESLRTETQLDALRLVVNDTRRRCSKDPGFKAEVAALVRGHRAA